MKSILFLSVMNGGAWGGSEEQWYQTALWMCKNNYAVDVCVFDWENKKTKLQVLQQYNCTIYLLPNKGSGIFKKWCQKKILNAISFDKYDFVYINQGGWKEVTHHPFKNLYKKLPSFALSFHNYHLGIQYPAHKIGILNSWMKKAAACIADSGKIFDMLENEYAICDIKKEVFYNPVTFEPPSEITPYALPRDNEPWVLVVLCALDVGRKAQDVLIKVLNRPVWRTRNWELHLYGDGDDKALLENLIKALQLGDKVFLKGHSGNVKNVLSTAHLLIQATHLDGMPISVTEAMAMSRPCLVSIVGDMTDWITDGYNGFITDKATENALQVAMERAWNKRNEWKQMGINAHGTFIQKYPQPYEEKFAALLTEYFIKDKKKQ